jgi:hypothetical protein
MMDTPDTMDLLGAVQEARACCWHVRHYTQLSPVSVYNPLFHPSFVSCFTLLIDSNSTEILVDVVDVVLNGSGIDEKFLGVTLFALVPNTTEFMNAMSFAMNGNIALRYVLTVF